SAYETKTNRKKLANAYSAKSKLVAIFHVPENANIMLRTTNGRAMIFNTALLLPKAARDTIGVQCMTCKAKSVVDRAFIVTDEQAEELKKYKSKTIPVAGSFAKDIEDPDQLSF
ncbi:MAG: topoisomerase IV, partial [Ruminococcus sp.]|nr:topoisomerase IV [Ruminococcus sp.]